MPYNNTPITPPKEITGAVSLPLARVKKIIATDDEISNCSNNAAFVITVAAEMFLQHLVEQSYNIVRSDTSGRSARASGGVRKNVQYRDVAAAVSRVENLEFLTDVVPKTTTYRTFKQKQANTSGPTEATKNNPPTTNGDAKGQGTLDQHMEMQATNGASRKSPGVEADVDAERGGDAGDAMDVDVTEDVTEDVEDEGDDESEEEEGAEVPRPPPKHSAHPEQGVGVEMLKGSTDLIEDVMRSRKGSSEPVERVARMEE